MSTLTDIKAVAGLFKRKINTTRVRGSTTRPNAAEAVWIADTATMATWLPLILPGKEESVVIQGTATTRFVPFKFPDFPTLLAVDYDVEYKWGEYDTITQGATQVGESLCMVRIQFEEPPFGLTGDDPYASISAQGWKQVIPTDAVTFSGGGTPGYDVGLPVSGFNYAIRVMEAPAVDAAVENYWRQQCGKVNTDTFRNAPPGYAIFDYPQIEYVYKKFGTRVCNYTHYIRTSTIPWTQAYKRDGTLGTLQVGGGDYLGAIPFNSLWY
jgi:hypothetical protein